MATTAEAFSSWAWNGSAGTYRLRSVLDRVGAYDIPNNRSLVRVRTWLQSTAPAYFYDIDTNQDLWLDGGLQQRYGSRRSITAGGSTLVIEGQYWLTHNAVGDRTVTAKTAFSSSFTGLHEVSVTLALDRIPRATTPTWSGNFTAGVQKRITLDRASTAFTHEVRYLWSGGNVVVATAAGANFDWTPPLSLVDAIPNSTTGHGTIRVVTKNGSTVIGTKDKQFTLEVPASIVPTVSQVLWDDANPVTKSTVGAFVQGASLIKGAVTAAGIRNSTIKSRSLVAGGQAFTEADSWQPTTSGPINAEGRAVDSRGRVGVKAANFNVLAYAPPTIDATTRVRRTVNNSGTLGDGPYLRLDITASVQSLTVSSVQKNSLTLTVKTRAVGSTGAWTTRNNVTPSGVLSYTNQYIQISGGDQFATNTSYDIEVTIADKLGNKATTSYRIGTIKAALDLANNAAGIGKIWERGTLDVGGVAYATNFIADGAVTAGTNVTANGTVTAGTNVIANGTTLCPIGAVFEWYAASTPTGYLRLEGQAVSRTTYAQLFALWGTQFGAGNGTSTFNLPDKRGRTAVGVSSDTEFNTLGKKFGTKTHTLTVAQMPSHNHRVISSGRVWTDSGANLANGSYHAGTLNAPNTGNRGGGEAHNNIQPSIAAHFIVRAL